MSDMTPSRPYLIRAIREWVVDNGLTPYLLVKATGNNVKVPERFIESGQIILNVSPQAVRDLNMGNDFIAFRARFNDIVEEIFVPISSVLAIYARENGRGMAFGEDEDAADDDEPPMPPHTGGNETGGGDKGGSEKGSKTKRAHLTVVK